MCPWTKDLNRSLRNPKETLRIQEKKEWKPEFTNSINVKKKICRQLKMSAPVHTHTYTFTLPLFTK